MKCIVCGKVYEGSECPRCRFPDVQIPGDREAALAALKPQIDQYRQSFLQSIRVEVVTYHWKDKDGLVVKDREDRLSLGTGDQLMHGETWLPQKFARLPQQDSLDVTLCITAGEDVQNKTVTVPNLHKAELQQLGAEMDPECRIRLLLRNETEAPTRSGFVPLF